MVLRANQRMHFIDKFEEENVYMISNFKIVTAPSLYNVMSGETALSFFHKTTITKTRNTLLIPKYKFELVSFEEARLHVGDTTQLIGKQINIKYLIKSLTIILLFFNFFFL